MTELYVSLITRLEELRQSERGQTMAEYGVILAVITVLVVGAVTLLSGNITGAITRVAGVVGGAGNKALPPQTAFSAGPGRARGLRRSGPAAPRPRGRGLRCGPGGADTGDVGRRGGRAPHGAVRRERNEA